jgi:hypothetical protein
MPQAIEIPRPSWRRVFSLISGRPQYLRITGVVGDCHAPLASPRPKSLSSTDLYGTEDIGPEDTADGDYGRLLDWAYERRLRERVGAPGGI